MHSDVSAVAPSTRRPPRGPPFEPGPPPRGAGRLVERATVDANGRCFYRTVLARMKTCSSREPRITHRDATSRERRGVVVE